MHASCCVCLACVSLVCSCVVVVCDFGHDMLQHDMGRWNVLLHLVDVLHIHIVLGRIGTLINTVVVSSQQLLAAYESKNNDRITAAESVRNEVATALNDLATSDVGEIVKKLDVALTKAKNEAKAYIKAQTSALTEEARQQSDKLSTTIQQCEALLSQLVCK